MRHSSRSLSLAASAADAKMSFAISRKLFACCCFTDPPVTAAPVQMRPYRPVAGKSIPLGRAVDGQPLYRRGAISAHQGVPSFPRTSYGCPSDQRSRNWVSSGSGGSGNATRSFTYWSPTAPPEPADKPLHLRRGSEPQFAPLGTFTET